MDLEIGFSLETWSRLIEIRTCWWKFSVTSKKSPNDYKICPKNDFTSKMKDFDNFTKIA